MKKFLVLLAVLIISQNIKSRPINEFEKWQAEKIVSYLKNEEFIFLYCDCCDDNNNNVTLIDIKNVDFEPSSSKYYKVRLRGKTVATFSTDKLGRLSKEQNANKMFNDIISIDFSFIPKNNKLLPLFEILEIYNVREEIWASCQEFVEIPKPTLKIFSNNKKYLDYYNQHYEKIDYSTKIVGVWDFFEIYNINGEMLKNTSNKNLKYTFKSDNTYFTNIGDGGFGKYYFEDNELVLVSPEGKIKSKSPFIIVDNILRIKEYDEKQGLYMLEFSKNQ